MNKSAPITETTQTDIEDGIVALETNPADLVAQGKMMAALGKAKVEQTQGISIGKEGIKANGIVGSIVVGVIAFALCWAVIKVGPELVKAWKGGEKAPAAQVETP
jgi:hypothetical protein